MLAGVNVSRIDQLRPRHKECLRLVAQLKDSNEIALELGISPNTVNGYLAEARTILGAVSSRQAARALLDHEGSPPPLPPHFLGGEETRVEPEPLPQPSLLLPERRSGTNLPLRDSNRLAWEVGEPQSRGLLLSLFTLGGRVDDLTAWERIGFIVKAAIAIATLVVIVVALAEVLVRLGHAFLQH